MGYPKTGATGPGAAACETLSAPPMVCRFDDFELDVERLELQRAGELVRADTLVLRVLALLVRHPGRLVTKDELVRHVWDGRVVADNAITVSISRLRKLLGDRAGREHVVSVYGRGYRFVGEVSFETQSVDERGALVSAAPGPIAESAEDARAPFVGRERLMGRLRRALSEARRGRGQACMLMGEPGIGKTRVVEALERELAASGVRIAWGYCREAGDTPPLWPFLRILRTVTDAAFPTTLEQRIGSLAQEVRMLLSGPSPSSESALDPMRVEQLGFRGAARHRGLDAILRTLAVAAEQTPWVIVLEDLHRADSASLELLGLLLDELAHTRILVVATLRHKSAGRTQRSDQYLSEVVGHRNCERISLERLTEPDVARYVRALLKDADDSIARAIFTQSEGNPFFMTELSRQLEENGIGSRVALAIPSSALDVIKQRLSRLEPEARMVLSAAAVIGRTFELSVLSAVSGREPADLMATLDDAIGTEVLTVAPDSSTAFAFSHELLRMVLYEALSPAERRSWHLVVAHALEARLHTGHPIPPSELAFHCHAALPQGDLRRTVSYCRAAASASAAAFANQDVVRYARHALEALDLMERPSIRLRLHLLLAIALYSRSYASTDFVGLVNEVIRLATEHGDAFSLVRAACLLYPHPGFKPMPGSLPVLERALGMLDDRHAGVRALAAAALACTAPHCYADEDNRALIGNALEPARESGLRGVLPGVLRCQLYLHGGPDHELENERTASELERLCAEDPSVMPALPAELAIHRAIKALQHGDASRVTTMLERAQARCREIVHTELLWHTERFAAIARINVGDVSRGLSRLEAVHAEAEQRRIVGFEPFRAFDRAVICDELAESRVLCEADQRALVPDPSDPPSVWSLKLRALASAGLSNEALVALRSVAASELVRLPCDTDYLGTLGHVTRAVLRLGARDYYESLYALLSRYSEHYSGGVSFFCEGAVAQLCGMLAQELGQRSKAISHFELAIHMNDRAGLEPRAAEARLQLSRCLLEQPKRGGKEHALTLAGDARLRATRLGIARLSHEASALRARAQSAHTM